MRYQDLLNDVTYWLDNDDDGFRFQFLHYLVNGHVSSLSDSIKREPFKFSSKSSELPMIYFDPFCLSDKALQFCIDSCLFIADVYTLHHFLVLLGCCAIRDNSLPFELILNHLDVSGLDFRLRYKYFRISFKSGSSSNRSKLYKAIDSFIKHSDFKDYFLRLLDWDSSLCIY